MCSSVQTASGLRPLLRQAKVDLQLLNLVGVPRALATDLPPVTARIIKGLGTKLEAIGALDGVKGLQVNVLYGGEVPWDVSHVLGVVAQELHEPGSSGTDCIALVAMIQGTESMVRALNPFQELLVGVALLLVSLEGYCTDTDLDLIPIASGGGEADGSFAQRITRFREEKKLTQEQFARKSMVPLGFIRRLEKGDLDSVLVVLGSRAEQELERASSFGENIKQMRKQKELSQKELAKAASVPPGFLKRVEEVDLDRVLSILNESPVLDARVAIGIEIRFQRERLGWARKALARKAGVPVTSLVDIEKRGRGCDDHLTKIASVLGLKLEQLKDFKAGDAHLESELPPQNLQAMGEALRDLRENVLHYDQKALAAIAGVSLTVLLSIEAGRSVSENSVLSMAFALGIKPSHLLHYREGRPLHTTLIRRSSPDEIKKDRTARGQEISRLRREAKLSQAQLAKKLELGSPHSLSFLERGERPYDKYIPVIAAILKVDPVALSQFKVGSTPLAPTRSPG
jgi:transcriptional regulator with XRE-family HTH domain